MTGPEQHADTVRDLVRKRLASNGDWNTNDWREAASILAERVDTLERELGDVHADGFDEGRESVNGEIVCSVCGFNHDRDESAACDGCEPVRFDEWVEQARAEADRLREALRLFLDYFDEHLMHTHSPSAMCRIARAALAGPQTKEQT